MSQQGRVPYVMMERRYEFAETEVISGCCQGHMGGFALDDSSLAQRTLMGGTAQGSVRWSERLSRDLERAGTEAAGLPAGRCGQLWSHCAFLSSFLTQLPTWPLSVQPAAWFSVAAPEHTGFGHAQDERTASCCAGTPPWARPDMTSSTSCPAQWLCHQGQLIPSSLCAQL